MGGIRFCYIPKGKNVYVKAIQPDGIINQDFGSGINVGNEAPYGHGKYDSTLRISGKYGFKHRDHKMYDKDETLVATDYTKYVNSTINDTLIGGLMHALNHWVDTANKVTTTYAKWTRTMASPINDDYPVPMLSDFNAVGSEDSIYMHYKHHVDSLISAYTKLNKSVYPTPSIYLYDTIKSGDNILPITKTNIGTTHPKVMLAINEDLGITVDGDAATSGLNARVGVTIKNDRKGSNDTFEVLVEMNESMFSDIVTVISDKEKALESELRSLLGISADVHLVAPNSIERSEGKAKRVIDKRKLID